MKYMKSMKKSVVNTRHMPPCRAFDREGNVHERGIDAAARREDVRHP
jgi:hypothetical protein